MIEKEKDKMKEDSHNGRSQGALPPVLYLATPVPVAMISAHQPVLNYHPRQNVLKNVRIKTLKSLDVFVPMTYFYKMACVFQRQNVVVSIRVTSINLEYT